MRKVTKRERKEGERNYSFKRSIALGFIQNVGGRRYMGRPLVPGVHCGVPFVRMN